MDIDAIADGAANLLAALAQGTLQGAGEEAGQRIYEAVAGRLRRSDDSQLLIALDWNPRDLAVQDRLRERIAIHLAADDRFRNLITAELEEPPAALAASINMTNSRGSKAAVAGANSRIEQNDNSRSFGGIIVAAVALAAIVAVALIALVGRTLYVNLVNENPTSLSGSNTCREYLAADDEIRRSTLRKLYMDAGKTEQASDVFLLENGDFDCGRRPDWTLNQIVASHGS